MAGTFKTDLLAVSILDADEAAGPKGFSARALQDVILKERDDLLRKCNELSGKLPTGTAKTNMAAVIADLG